MSRAILLNDVFALSRSSYWDSCLSGSLASRARSCSKDHRQRAEHRADLPQRRRGGREFFHLLLEIQSGSRQGRPTVCRHERLRTRLCSQRGHHGSSSRALRQKRLQRTAHPWPEVRTRDLAQPHAIPNCSRVVSLRRLSKDLAAARARRRFGPSSCKASRRSHLRARKLDSPEPSSDRSHRVH